MTNVLLMFLDSAAASYFASTFATPQRLRAASEEPAARLRPLHASPETPSRATSQSCGRWTRRPSLQIHTSMDPANPDKAVSPSPANPAPAMTQQSESKPSRLWRAIAGMAIALAIATTIVAVELSHDLVNRVTSYRSKIAVLNKKVDRLKQKAVADEKRLADARAEIKERKLMHSRDRIKAILIAPDRKMFKLTTPQPGESAAATVTISAKMGGAMLSAHGLTAPPEGQVYDAWWMLKNAPPAKAAEFRSGLDSSVIEYLDPPPQGSTPTLLAITLEPSQGGIAPTGPVKLQGKTPAGLGGEERSGGAKQH